MLVSSGIYPCLVIQWYNNLMKFLTILLAFLFMFLVFPKISFAIEDPLSKPNNKMGVHILFPSELSDAANIINSSNGDWGYVTIPIQAGDRDLEKWQKFMDTAKKLHVIPLVRLSTEGDYFNTSVWKKPSENDVLDFANFLNSLSWPVKNRYIIVFNEVNRGDEWEGTPEPEEYARILNFTVDTFKSFNGDFFIISSGMDNAAANVLNSSMNQYDYMVRMNEAVPDIFKKLDGLSSHSYPNPAFSQPPWINTKMSVTSFKFERDLVEQLSGKKLPVFITETGWSSKKISRDVIASYFDFAFKNVWSENFIVAVTPFLLHAGSEPFEQFSLLSKNAGETEISKSLKSALKTRGEPTVNFNTALAADLSSDSKVPVKTFPQEKQYKLPPLEKTKTISMFFKWLLNLSI